MIFDVLGSKCLPEDAPSRTPQGRPWVRWCMRAEDSGWCAAGARRPSFGAKTFWETTFAVACRAAGSNVDQVHAVGSGILALGGLGVTLSSGYAQKLLYKCLEHNPARFLEVMAPVVHATGVFVKPCAKSPSGIALMDERGHPLLTETELRSLVTGGAAGVKWTSKQKSVARLWVSVTSELLRDDSMDAAQCAFASEVLPELLCAPVRQGIRWSPSSGEDTWQHTKEQQMLWSFALIMSMTNAHATEVLLSVAKELGSDADYSPESMLGRVKGLVGKPSLGWFRDRGLCVFELLEEAMNITIGGKQ